MAQAHTHLQPHHPVSHQVPAPAATTLLLAMVNRAQRLRPQAAMLAIPVHTAAIKVTLPTLLQALIPTVSQPVTPTAHSNLHLDTEVSKEAAIVHQEAQQQQVTTARVATVHLQLLLHQQGMAHPATPRQAMALEVVNPAMARLHHHRQHTAQLTPQHMAPALPTHPLMAPRLHHRQATQAQGLDRLPTVATPRQATVQQQALHSLDLAQQAKLTPRMAHQLLGGAAMAHQAHLRLGMAPKQQLQQLQQVMGQLPQEPALTTLTQVVQEATAAVPAMPLRQHLLQGPLPMAHKAHMVSQALARATVHMVRQDSRGRQAMASSPMHSLQQLLSLIQHLPVQLTHQLQVLAMVGVYRR